PGLLLLAVHDLLDARLVTAAGERSLQPRAQNVFRLGLGQEPRTERKDIRIIVFAAIPSGSFIVAQGPPDAPNLVGRHAGTDARAVDNHTASGGPGAHQFRYQMRDIRIVGRL